MGVGGGGGLSCTPPHRAAPHARRRCLILLEFLLREGNAEMVLAQIQNNLHLISALTNFRLINDQHIDVGMPVRERADRFLRFLRDEPTSEDREMGRRAPPPGFSAGPPAEEAWKSQVRWDAADGPAVPQYGAPRPTGGKFSVVIKPKDESAAPVPKLGTPATSGGGGPSRPPPSDMDLLGDMSAPAPPAAPPNDLFAAPVNDPFASPAGGNDPFASPGGADPFAANCKSHDPFGSARGTANDPFGSPATSDPFASNGGGGPDPFGVPRAPDPFATQARSNDPFGSSTTSIGGAAVPMGGTPSLMDGPGGQDELLSLALPTNVMPSSFSAVPTGVNDMQLLGGIDLASPTKDGRSNPFPNSDPFGAPPATAPAPEPQPDQWASIKQSNIINLDNLNISGKETAAPKPAPTAPKQSLAQMASKSQAGAGAPTAQPILGSAPMSVGGMGSAPMGSGGMSHGGIGGVGMGGSGLGGGMPMSGMGGGMGGGRPMGGMGGPPMSTMGGGVGGLQMGMGGMGSSSGGMGGPPMGMGGMGSPSGGMGGPPMGMGGMGSPPGGMGGPPMGMPQHGYGMPQQGYGMQPNPFAQPQRGPVMPPMQPRKPA